MREPNKLQGDGNWWANRIGKLTGSRMATAIDFKKNGEETSKREELRYAIVAERISNTFADNYVTAEMQFGIDFEPAAKDAFESRTGLIVTDLPFIDHPKIPFCGASPDGLVSDGCLIEIKVPKTKTHLKYIQAGVVPEEHKPQMMLQSACTGKDIWFVSYDPRLPEEQSLFIIKYKPTPEEIDDIETKAIKFLQEVDQLFDFYTTKAIYFKGD